MTVHELIDNLRNLDGSRLVVLAKDAEGNSFSPAAELSTGTYIARTTWSGEVVAEAEAETDDETDSDNSYIAVVIWPTN